MSLRMSVKGWWKERGEAGKLRKRRKNRKQE